MKNKILTLIMFMTLSMITAQSQVACMYMTASEVKSFVNNDKYSRSLRYYDEKAEDRNSYGVLIYRDYDRKETKAYYFLGNRCIKIVDMLNDISCTAVIDVLKEADNWRYVENLTWMHVNDKWYLKYESREIGCKIIVSDVNY